MVMREKREIKLFYSYLSKLMTTSITKINQIHRSVSIFTWSNELFFKWYHGEFLELPWEGDEPEGWLIQTAPRWVGKELMLMAPYCYGCHISRQASILSFIFKDEEMGSGWLSNLCRLIRPGKSRKRTQIQVFQWAEMFSTASQMAMYILLRHSQCLSPHCLTK